MKNLRAMSKRRRREMQHKEVLRVCSKLLIPLIMLFALYVQYALIFGVDVGMKVLSPGARRFFLSAGLLLYAGVGIAGMFLGGRYLNYSVLLQDPVAGQHLGILLIELGVGVTVAASMITIFYVFANQDESE